MTFMSGLEGHSTLKRFFLLFSGQRSKVIHFKIRSDVNFKSTLSQIIFFRKLTNQELSHLKRSRRSH